MPIIIKQGDIFKADVEALVNPVNCVGIMGRGLALKFKQLFPDYYDVYKTRCSMSLITPGNVHVHDRWEGRPQYIISFPTKAYWRDSSQLRYIEQGMISLNQRIEYYRIQSIAIPALGCGLGGLKWEDVKPLIIRELNVVNVDILLYEPRGNLK